ncbi:MAG: hypothetical protein ACYTEW_27060 [Planctomycetota bacterium]|jgi:hypothetical protein
MKTNWGRSLPKVIMELHANKPTGMRYWAVRVLLLFAARIINSELITRRTLPTLEAD